MALPVFVNLSDVNGRKGEAVALARHEGELLPPGVWKVQYPDGKYIVMCVEEMPAHWQEQLHRIGEFGKTLKDLDDTVRDVFEGNP